MKSLQKLGKLGNKLHISNSAVALRDETQLQVLQNKGNSKWIRENIADAFAKSICAQVTLNKRTPDVQQNKKLQGDALQHEVENIKRHPTFQNML